MSCRNKNIILGLPWLKGANPDINWEEESLTLDDKIDQSRELVEQHNIQNITKFNPSKYDPSGTYYEPQDRKGLFNHLDYEEPKPFTIRAIKACAWETILQASLIKWPNNAEIRKVNMATELAREAERLKPKPTLPPETLAFPMFLTNHKKAFFLHPNLMTMLSSTYDLCLTSGCYSDEKGDKFNKRRCNSERRRCKSDVGEDKSYWGGVQHLKKRKEDVGGEGVSFSLCAVPLDRLSPRILEEWSYDGVMMEEEEEEEEEE